MKTHAHTASCCSAGGVSCVKHRSFRDWFRAARSDLDLYADTKRESAALSRIAENNPCSTPPTKKSS